MPTRTTRMQRSLSAYNDYSVLSIQGLLSAYKEARVAHCVQGLLSANTDYSEHIRKGELLAAYKDYSLHTRITQCKHGLLRAY